MNYPTPYLAVALRRRRDRRIWLERRMGEGYREQWQLPGRKFTAGKDWAQNLDDFLRAYVGEGVSGEEGQLFGLYTHGGDGGAEAFATAGFLVPDYGAIPPASVPGDWFAAESLPEGLSQADLRQVRDALDFNGTVFLH